MSRPFPPLASPALHRRIAALLAQLVPADGIAPTVLDGVALQRAVPVQAQGQPAIAVAAGADGRFRCVVPGNQQAPHAQGAIVVTVDLAVAAELLLALDAALPARPPGGTPFGEAPLDAALADTVLRLLGALREPQDARILGQALLRELLYRVLCGPLGDAFRAAIRRHGHVARIARALRRIEDSYDHRMDIATLARDAGMSVTAFHAQFKMVTGTTPIQYLKATRLQKARVLMAREGLSAAAASHLVGYESSSHFSREFKRMYGHPPGHDAAAMRKVLGGAPQP